MKASIPAKIEPVLRVDPQGRCAAMLVYDKYFAIIPFPNKEEDFLLEPPSLFQSKSVFSFPFLLPHFLIAWKKKQKEGEQFSCGFERTESGECERLCFP